MTRPPKWEWSFLLPKYWLSWFGVGLLWLLVKLPKPIAVKVGQGLGWLMRQFMPKRLCIAEVNLRRCFPEWNEKKVQSMAKKSFAELGLGVFFSGVAWWGSDKKVASWFHAPQIDTLNKINTNPSATLLLSYHAPILELAARFVSMHIKTVMFYKAQKNRVVNYISTRARLRFCHDLIDRSGEAIRGVIKVRREQLGVFYLCDQDYGRRNSIFAPFLAERAAATVPLPEKLVKKAGFKAVFIHGARVGLSYNIGFNVLDDSFFSGPEGEATARLNEMIGEKVAAYPEQYMWLHRRFKTRPDPAEKVY